MAELPDMRNTTVLAQALVKYSCVDYTLVFSIDSDDDDDAQHNDTRMRRFVRVFNQYY